MILATYTNDDSESSPKYIFHLPSDASVEDGKETYDEGGRVMNKTVSFDQLKYEYMAFNVTLK